MPALACTRNIYNRYDTAEVLRIMYKHKYCNNTRDLTRREETMEEKTIIIDASVDSAIPRAYDDDNDPANRSRSSARRLIRTVHLRRLYARQITSQRAPPTRYRRRILSLSRRRPGMARAQEFAPGTFSATREVGSYIPRYI